MLPTDLDTKLESMAKPLSPLVEAEAMRLADAMMPARVRRGLVPRARWVAPVLLGGVLVLSAGAGTATVAMSHWAGVSMPLENVRNTEPIVISWTTDSGHEETCRGWIEIRNPQPEDRALLDAAVTASDWDGLGQEIYDSARPDVEDTDGERRVGDGLDPVLRQLARTTFPGIPVFSEAASDERAVDALGMTCTAEIDE